MDIDKLGELIKAADEAYYNTGAAPLPDAQYDKLKTELKKRDPNSPLLKKVGATPPGHLAQAKHSIPMGSQLHAQTDEEFWDWWVKVGKPAIILTDKVDGSSAAAYYEDGKLKQVVSRGDGEVGQDITANALKWKNLPKTIKMAGKVSVRGEAILYKADWATHFPDTANPRNMGNGIVTRKDGDGNEHIRLVAFDIVVDKRMFVKQIEKFLLLGQLGFDTVPSTYCDDEEAIKKAWADYGVRRDTIPYEIDGVVAYINDLGRQALLGYTDNRPKGQIAWKFKALEAITEVIGMTITMGHSGALIPTAKLKPVSIGGVTVQNVLLTTFARLIELDVNIGDIVAIQRAGDVIPYLDRIVEKKYAGHYPVPTECPYCKTKLVAVDRYTICPNNDTCPEQQKEIVKNWINKTNIKHLGDELIETLFNGKVLTKIVNLYLIDWKLAAKVKRGAGQLGDKMAAKIAEEIDKTRKLPLYKFIGSLGLKGLGQRQAANMGLKSVNDFLNLTEEMAAQLEGTGETKAGIIVKSIQNRKAEILELLEHITIEAPATAVSTAKPGVKQLSFCLTGKMTRQRKEIEADIVAAGHIAKDDVGAGLDYLVMATPDAASSKAKKAAKHGTQTISEEQLVQILAEPAPSAEPEKTDGAEDLLRVLKKG